MSYSERQQPIQARIHAACGRAGRDAREVKLVAVSKGQPVEAIIEAAGHGQVIFAESRVQEAKGKIAQCPGHLRWQMIGHLQTNKCRDAVGLFELVQSVDSIKIAEELNKRCEQAAKDLPVLLEVNVAGEASKFGYPPDRILAELEALNALPRIAIHGLMTIAPYSAHPERARPFFRKLRELKQACEDLLGAPLPELSMGMSGDFEVAIEEGATLVRVGTALFGDR